jgi:hypothetical protein
MARVFSVIIGLLLWVTSSQMTNRLEKVKNLANTILLERAAEASTFGSN